MKTFITLAATAIAFSTAGAGAAEPGWVASYDTLLGKYRTASGVKYKAWHAADSDRRALANIVAAIGSESVSGKSEDEKLAFYLNAYNAWILHRILEDYPTSGPGGGGLLGRNKFFKSKGIKVAGKTTSFHALENEIIRKQFDEPRIHFALNCASASCPPLHSKAFRAATLDKTLDSLTKDFVNSNPEGVGSVKGGKVAVSKIFDWYGEDFKPAGGVLAYLNRYRTKKIPEGTRVTFQTYRWTLNAAR